MLVAVAACSRGGSPSLPGSGAGTAPGITLAVVGHTPNADALQVDPNAILSVAFDGAIAPECLLDPSTGLVRVHDGELVPAALSLVGARVIEVRPRQPLDPETDYELRCSPLTCDLDGRLLDDTFALPFRTTDPTPPRILGRPPADAGRPVERGAVIVIQADEHLDPRSVDDTTVALIDDAGSIIPADVTCAGDEIHVRPVVDLRGNAGWAIVVAGIQDRSGNRLLQPTNTPFHSAADLQGPTLIGVWPTNDAVISPRAHVELRFDESVAMPSPSARPVLSDAAGHELPATIRVSRDQRTLHVFGVGEFPEDATLRVESYADDGVTDVSGNPYGEGVLVRFVVGHDRRPPLVGSSWPAEGAVRIDPRTLVELSFDEAIDPTHLLPSGIELRANGELIPLTAIIPGGEPNLVVALPAHPLPTEAVVEVLVPAASEVFRDLAGNSLANDIAFTFTTSHDSEPLTLLMWPEPDAFGVPYDATLALLADGPLDATTANTARVRVLDDDDREVSGRLDLERGDRVLRFIPDAAWTPGAAYRMEVAGGRLGLRKLSGNWMETDLVQRFRVGYRSDADPPDLEVTVASIGSPRNADRVIATRGVTFDLRARAGTDPALDLTSARLELEGPGSVPDAEALFARAEFTNRTLRVRLAPNETLLPGRYVLRGRVRDLSGGEGAAPPLTFDVAEPVASIVPFERTQVVWVRFDLDRDDNGRADFDDDLIRLGLATPNDPLGTNARVAAWVRGGVLAEAHRIFGRRADGAPASSDAIPLRLTVDRPLGIPSMQIACGGLDPDGTRNRGFGQASTGTLGRARYDYRNAQIDEQATSTSPALGVFPAELFLFEARVHLDVYPGYVTSFARRFLPITPDLGGTPAGSGAFDATVLGAGFDPASATGAQRARWESLTLAADDWAVCVGTILAHEIGHAVGLVTPGRTSDALHGDASLHNEFSSPGDVMAATIGFDSMVGLPFAFRDINLAYLGQKVLLR